MVWVEVMLVGMIYSWLIEAHVAHVGSHDGHSFMGSHQNDSQRLHA